MLSCSDFRRSCPHTVVPHAPTSGSRALNTYSHVSTFASCALTAVPHAPISANQALSAYPHALTFASHAFTANLHAQPLPVLASVLPLVPQLKSIMLFRHAPTSALLVMPRTCPHASILPELFSRYCLSCPYVFDTRLECLLNTSCRSIYALPNVLSTGSLMIELYLRLWMRRATGT
jgi:hypothetical protein